MKKLFTILCMLLPLMAWAQEPGGGEGGSVVAPTFRFVGDSLVIETETPDASIFYVMADLPDMSEETIEAVSNSLTVTADISQSMYYEQPILLKKAVVLKAIAAGATESEVSTLVYDYNSWVNLLNAVAYGSQLYAIAEGNSKVDQSLVEELKWALEESDMIYSYRATIPYVEAIHFTQQIYELCNQIEAQLGGDPEIDYVFDNNGVLTVNSNVTLTEVLKDAATKHDVPEWITAIVWNSSKPIDNSELQELDNPNMLIYVNDENLAPLNRNNVVIGDFAKNIVLTDVSEGNGNFYCPHEFKAEQISYSHDYSQTTEIGVARGWESIALPFAVQTVTHETQGVIAPFGNDASNKHFWLRQLTENGLARATVIEPNTAYIISMPNNDAYIQDFNLNGRVTFSSENVWVPKTQIHAVDYHTGSGMVVLLPNFQRRASDFMTYALNVGEPRGDYPEGSVFEREYRDIRPFEAYTIHQGGPAPRFLPISDLNGGGATGIEEVSSLMAEGRGGVWYDLSGRRLQQKPAGKGVYILNGRKVVIR